MVFDKKGSYIEDTKTGDRMNLTERSDMFMLKIWTKSSSGRRC